MAVAMDQDGRLPLGEPGPERVAAVEQGGQAGKPGGLGGPGGGSAQNARISAVAGASSAASSASGRPSKPWSAGNGVPCSAARSRPSAAHMPGVHDAASRASPPAASSRATPSSASSAPSRRGVRTGTTGASSR
ncbi:hypothetical protein [Streptomyces sp. PT12]|uniref:hypothetical protein n=1 Tax=Streptomyces sp. PT12 TaxID=1510197 RepID=UPI00215B7888|nr:hypothetical protein [Streptomyces sp. PT12]